MQHTPPPPPTTNHHSTQPPRFVVVGHPIGHSRSPVIHQHFASQLGLAIQYQTLLAPPNAAHPKQPQAFAQTIRALQAAGVAGANITVPFKAQAYALAQHPSPHAQAVEVANTLYFAPDGSIHAHNTDGPGLCQSLAQHLAAQHSQLSTPQHTLPLAAYQVLLLGAGGAAQGVLLALKEAGIQHLWVANRTPENATALATRAQHLGLPAHVLPLAQLESPSHVPVQLGHAPVILLQASAAGLHGTATVPHPAWLQHVCLAYDMAYPAQQATQTPWQTQLAKLAPTLPTAHGLGMLVYQAWHAFVWWAKHGALHPHCPPHSTLHLTPTQQAIPQATLNFLNTQNSMQPHV